MVQLLVICICSLVKHLLNPLAPSGCFLWIVEVLYIFGLYQLLPRCYDKMSKRNILRGRIYRSLFYRFYVFVCSDIELQSIAEASLLLQAPLRFC